MKKLLPVLFVFFIFLSVVRSVLAQTPTPTIPLTTTPTTTATAVPTQVPTGTQQVGTAPTPTDGTWVMNSDVTFAGKAGARAENFLDWALANYDWIHLTGTTNPIETFFVTIRNIVYAFFALLILITAFILIVTQGKNITFRKFLPRFVIIALLVTFAFAIVSALYDVVDIIQGFFLRNPSGTGLISGKNLLFIGFDYQSFTGYQQYGVKFEESAFISILLVKLTAITYYVMTGILLLRKIILWFFIIISPIFPLLMLYSPVRKTGKVWIAEFFRWLLYAPIFAIFLSGLVHIWQSYIPLQIDTNQAQIYPTAINILLGGPGQNVFTNSLNNNDAFALYVVCLLMLWVVILLPFLLLQIFLDYLKTVSVGDNKFFQQIASGAFLGNRGNTKTPLEPSGSGSTGMAKQLPFANRISIPTVASDMSQMQFKNIQTGGANTDILRLSNISVPTMRDIANYETSFLSNDIAKRQAANHTRETLEHIANPKAAVQPVEQQKYSVVKNRLVQEGQKGNPVATSILAAANSVNQTAGVTSINVLPVVNRVQSVSLDDYESVKKIWEENYQKLEPPHDISGKQKSRQEWIHAEIGTISQTISMLLSGDPANVKKGMESVGNILPFLLIGGFSKAEIVSYLKAKLEAARATEKTLSAKTEEEDTTMLQEKSKEEAPKEMKLEETLPEKEEKLAGDASNV